MTPITYKDKHGRVWKKKTKTLWVWKALRVNSQIWKKSKWNGWYFREAPYNDYEGPFETEQKAMEEARTG